MLQPIDRDTFDGDYDYRCPKCEGNNLRFIGGCYWNTGEQWWELDDVDTQDVYCRTCRTDVEPVLIAVTKEDNNDA